MGVSGSTGKSLSVGEVASSANSGSCSGSSSASTCSIAIGAAVVSATYFALNSWISSTLISSRRLFTERSTARSIACELLPIEAIQGHLFGSGELHMLQPFVP